MEGIFTTYKVEISMSQYAKYDFFNCNDKQWFELKKAYDEAKKALKEREEFLKSITAETEVDGLIIYPPDKRIETNYKLTPIK